MNTTNRDNKYKNLRRVYGLKHEDNYLGLSLSKIVDPDLIFDNFISGTENSKAKEIVYNYSDKYESYDKPLLIYGSTGNGKSYLLNALAAHVLDKNPNCRIAFISTYDFIDAIIKTQSHDTIAKFIDSFKGIDLLLFDDIQLLFEYKSVYQDVLSTIVDNLIRNRKKICFTSSNNINDIEGLNKRILSVIKQANIVNISKPYYETRLRIITQDIEQDIQGIKFDDEAISFIASKFSDSVRLAEKALMRTVLYCLDFSFKDTDRRINHVTLSVAEKALEPML